MKKLFSATIILFSFFLLTSHTNKKAEEGMFPLSEIKDIDLGKIGLKIAPQELYNPKGISLIDAVVRVGGCTGSFVSDEGLIVTNHHCAFGFVQAISTPQNNYIKHGFLANNKSEEVKATGLICKITASYEDVSAKVLERTQDVADANERARIMAENIKAITEQENAANAGLQCEISEMFTGRTYVLFRYKLLKDVRVVYVPARSIGEYGGELDNWVWPRHSGDFAFLRAYVAPDGSSAEYNTANVPYKPAKFLKVNPKGVKENDFVFVLGYPGRTFRHQPAAFYKYHEQYMLKYISDLFDWQISEMEKLGEGSDSLQIRYAGRMKSLANVTKNYKGKLQGFRRAGLTAQKYAEEKQMQDFINADPKLNKQFGDVIPRINMMYDEIIQQAPRSLWFDYIYSVAPALGTAAAINNYGDAYRKLKTPEEKKEFLEKQTPRIKRFMARYFSAFDKPFEEAAFAKMITDAQTFDKNNRIETVDNFVKQGKGKSIDEMTNALYAKSIFLHPDKVKQLMDKDLVKLLSLQDPLVQFASKLNEEVNPMDDADRKREGLLNLLMARYVDAKSVWKSKQFIPDANGTLRFTYGYIKGFSPNDADYNAPITTLKGVIEKEDGKDYELMQVIKELYAARDFGAYIHPDLNDLPVNILYNLDTTGGNSGSPVMDAYGQLIGVNFDRAYTATINDYAWNETYSRSVGVDIRYVLWILQKVAKAQYLVDEMGVKG